MADNDQDNEEYKYSEIDSMDNEPMDQTSQDFENPESSGQSSSAEKPDIRRNALIVVGAVLLIFALYKILGSMFSGKTVETAPAIPPISKTEPARVTPTPILPVQTVIKEVDTELKQKVSDMELHEQGIKSEVIALKDQVDTVNTNVNNLNTQIARLNQVLNDLSTQVANQSNVIAMLMARAQPKRIAKPINRVQPHESIKYNIQAVIPGRAWLIGSNGSTLTVRAGTKINGYGVVKLIDSIQGRVLTSSGRVIRFGQDDS